MINIQTLISKLKLILLYLRNFNKSDAKVFIPIKMKGFSYLEIPIPIKMKGFLNLEISIYSHVGFFIYLFEDLYKDFLMKPRVRRFSSKMFEDFLQNK